MKFSEKIEVGTSNEPLNCGSDPWPWWRFVLSECTLYYVLYTARCYIYLRNYITEFSFVIPMNISACVQKHIHS